MSLRIRIRRREGALLPRYATSGAAGCDLCACLNGVSLTLLPHEWVQVPTGLYIELPEGYEGQVRPRSGLANDLGLTVLNAPGTIDADYRGEIKVLLVNHGPRALELTDGQRIAQLVIAPVVQAVWEEVDSLSDTERGAGGFGHTGHSAELP